MHSWFIRDLQRLRHWCPPSKPVVVYRVCKHHAHGSFGWADGRLIITIRIDDGYQERETLVHEWAHALTYNESRPKQRIMYAADIFAVYDGPMPWVRHGDEWGIAYARCYRAVQVPTANKFEPDHIEMIYRL